MYPQICQIGPFPIYSFGLMFLLALVICSYLLSREAGKYGLSADEIYDLVFWVVVAGIVGARLFFIFLNLPFFVENPGEILLLNKGGLAWQGGLILGFSVGLFYARRLKIQALFLGDLLAPYVALGQGIGRIGCFLNGCCYGRPVSWGLYFPVHHDRLHPTQLYDFTGLLLIFFVLKYFQKFLPKQGQTLALYLILASVERFINEFFRADHEPFFFGLSIFQVVSLAVFLGGVIMLVILQQRGKIKVSPRSSKAA